MWKKYYEVATPAYRDSWKWMKTSSKCSQNVASWHPLLKNSSIWNILHTYIHRKYTVITNCVLMVETKDAYARESITTAHLPTPFPGDPPGKSKRGLLFYSKDLPRRPTDLLWSRDLWTSHRLPPFRVVFSRGNPVSVVELWEPSHMPI